MLCVSLRRPDLNLTCRRCLLHQTGAANVPWPGHRDGEKDEVIYDKKPVTVCAMLWNLICTDAPRTTAETPHSALDLNCLNIENSNSCRTGVAVRASIRSGGAAQPSNGASRPGRDDGAPRGRAHDGERAFERRRNDRALETERPPFYRGDRGPQAATRYSNSLTFSAQRKRHADSIRV